MPNFKDKKQNSCITSKIWRKLQPKNIIPRAQSYYHSTPISWIRYLNPQLSFKKKKKYYSAKYVLIVDNTFYKGALTWHYLHFFCTKAFSIYMPGNNYESHDR